MRFAKTCNMTRLKCCACHAKWRWRSPKRCACHEKCNASFKNVAKVLRLPHKTTFGALRSMLECHKVPPLPRKTKLRDAGNLQKWPVCKTYHRHGHVALTQSPAAARSTCASQNAQYTLGHSWTLRCSKNARAVAQSMFRCQNEQGTAGSEHFWKLRRWKGARHC